MTNEFIDAYSDDQIYLTLIKDLVNDHPVEVAVPDSIKYSAFCRLWVSMAVGSIESMIKVWNTGDELWSDIATYLNRKSNENRIKDLKASFERRGLNLDPEIYKDFLALKYIRNAYIHSDWSPSQRSYVVSRGFPGNMMQFNKEHLDRMQKVYIGLMNGLGMINALNATLRR
ncbi:hypothetical protein [Tabrizicola aquatica]|uniref:hypothetical protein n=1 Tax=Tabrizicola aquatica TaxID=909926 RepID=UPI000CD26F28|nr:hypothetical protein [Tabrizicola aquatica]